MPIFQRRIGLINVPYTAAKGLLIWLMLLNPGTAGLFVASTAAVGFGAEFFLMERTAKDAEQDKRMDYIDERDSEERAQRTERRAESQAWNHKQDDELKELSDSVHQLYGWGLGAFGAVTVLQIVGLLRRNKEE